MKKRIVTAAVILITLTAILYFVPIKFNITKTMTARVYENIKSGTSEQTRSRLTEHTRFTCFARTNTQAA